MEAARQYLDQHKVQEVISKAVSAAYKARAENLESFLADYFRVEAGGNIIDKVTAREILDSRGNPTVEVDVYSAAGDLLARSAVPSGASTGSNEAVELRDGDKRYLGKGVQQAVANVSAILAPAVAGKDVTDLLSLDKALMEADGTELKEKAGGNAVTATSFALAEAGAAARKVQLFQHLASTFHQGGEQPRKFRIPTPMVNILNGGKHAGGKLKIQEFMIVPRRACKFSYALQIATEVYHALGKILVESYGPSARNLGDEGGYAPSLDTPEEALTAIEEAIVKAGYVVGEDVRLALDAAASEFYSDGKYELESGKFFSTEEAVEYYEKMVDAHPALISIEDPLDEKDYEGWKLFTERLGSRIMVVGDDLYTTNCRLIEQGVANKWANSLLLKVNQIGTISEAMDAARMSFADNGQVIVSHRSGENSNTVISDLAVAIDAGYIKTGATARGERVSKYNRLLAIEEFLNEEGLLDVREE